MRTNKRTVWFLTVLSLVAVLSIYTLNKKNPLPFDGITIFGDNQIPTSGSESSTPEEKQSVFAESYLFEEMRMEVRNERSQLQEQLTKKINDAETTEEMNEAYDEMEKLVKQQSNENLLEMQVKSLGYADAFVQAEDGNISVSVLSEEGHSTTQAQEITHLIMTSWDGAKNVKVDFKGDS